MGVGETEDGQKSDESALRRKHRVEIIVGEVELGVGLGCIGQ